MDYLSLNVQTTNESGNSAHNLGADATLASHGGTPRSARAQALAGGQLKDKNEEMDVSIKY